MRSAVRRLALLLLAAGALLVVPAAHAAPPPLGGVSELPSPFACLARTALSGCTALGQLEQPSQVAVSANGKALYVRGADNLVSYARDPVTGHIGATLSCFYYPLSFSPPAAPCTAADPLFGSGPVAVAADGHGVYTVESVGDTVASWGVDPSTGAITGMTACVNHGGVAPCALSPANGVKSPDSVAVAPDGHDLYVGSRTPGGAVSVLSRNPTTGAVGAELACYGSATPNCTVRANVTRVSNVAAEGDGLYVISDNGFAFAFARDPDSGGILTNPAFQCFRFDAASPGCAHAEGIDNALGLALSPDGKSVYVGGYDFASTQGALAVFSRGANGLLGLAGCIANPSAVMFSCTKPAAKWSGALASPAALAVAPDGAFLYAGNQGLGNALTAFARSANGALDATPVNCLNGAGTGGCSPSPTVAHGGPYGSQDVALAPGDGRHVYAANKTNVMVFNRELAPTCTAGSATTASVAVQIPLSCADPNGDALTYSAVGPPANGQVAVNGASATYTPNAGFVGNDGFTFRATDGTAAAAPAAVTITVTKPGDGGGGGGGGGGDLPAARITAPGATVSARRLHRISGTAVHATRVEVAVLHATHGARAARSRPTCRWLSTKGRFVAHRAVKRRCGAPRFLPATGTATWSLRLRHRLTRGTYVIYARARDGAGHVQAAYTAALGNRRTVRVR